MNGAESLLRTAIAAGANVCFANPGTTELPIVAALDRVPEMRAVLALFEGVATGAADGYGRMAGKPALTMMHLGPSFGNGIANLHNARRARSPIVNIVGDHPSWHLPFDPPLAANIYQLASCVSGWVRTVASASTMTCDVRDALAAASSGQVATLIVPADCQWNEAAGLAEPARAEAKRTVDSIVLERACNALRQRAAGLLLGGRALSVRGLRAAHRIATATKCRLLCETFPARLECGQGLPSLERVPYVPTLALALLGSLKNLVLAGAEVPVSFFAEPDVASSLVPAAVATHVLAAPTDDVDTVLEALAEALRAPNAGDALRAAPLVKPADGPLTVASISAVIASIQPEGLVFVDEGVSAGGAHLRVAGSCPPFTYLSLTGGATGQGLPCAIGAAIACPGRRVLAFVGDGSAMYTVQSLWTHAHEQLDITTVVLSNHSYKILQSEMTRKMVAFGARAKALTELVDPRIGWTEIARAFGVPVSRVETTASFSHALQAALMEPGPHLIQAEM
jgi:acetolactate synthase-1/2/3 large subunit